MYTLLLSLLVASPAIAEHASFQNGRCVRNGKPGDPSPLEECGVGRYKSYTGLELSRRTLRGADLTSTSFVGLTGTQPNFEFANMVDTELRASNFRSASFYRANLRGARWTGDFCTDCSFSHGDLRAIRFSESNISGSDFQFARMEGAFIQRSKFRDCDFRGAKLNNVVWVNVKCERCLVDSTSELPWSRAEAERRGFVYR